MPLIRALIKEQYTIYSIKVSVVSFSDHMFPNIWQKNSIYFPECIAGYERTQIPQPDGSVRHPFPCVPCPQGEYKAQGMFGCVNCPAGTTTAGTGHTSADDCGT